MKKAVVVGGSNGIGLSVTKALIEKGYHPVILDKCPPDSSVGFVPESYTYHSCDLLDLDDTLITQLSDDETVELLMITAGFGRVADFEYLHPGEIQNMLQVNLVAGVRIIRLFYHRINNVRPFYCGMMGSIAGLVSSPMFSVYAASKAGICRFVESVNVELAMSGTSNRILNVSPGSVKGTRFNGGENDLSNTQVLAQQILDHLFASNELFIPDYEPTYKDVLARYTADAVAFGNSSYEYKKASGRAVNENRARIGYLSGTFDLFHVGHLNLLRRAKAQCDYLIVGVHPDASHKGKETFIPFEERMAVVGGIKYVDKVVPSCKEDSDAWSLWHYNRLFVGSDYKGSDRFARYTEFFRDKGVEIVYFPYTKSTSSTQIRQNILKKADEEGKR